MPRGIPSVEELANKEFFCDFVVEISQLNAGSSWFDRGDTPPEMFFDFGLSVQQVEDVFEGAHSKYMLIAYSFSPPNSEVRLRRGKVRYIFFFKGWNISCLLIRCEWFEQDCKHILRLCGAEWTG